MAGMFIWNTFAEGEHMDVEGQIASQCQHMVEADQTSPRSRQAVETGEVLSIHTHVNITWQHDTGHKVVEPCFLMHLACFLMCFGYQITILGHLCNLMACNTSAIFGIQHVQITSDVMNAVAEPLITSVYEMSGHETCTEVTCHDCVQH
jgi:hypothetical protein